MSATQPWLRKSRFGCKSCKLRKVKCDEIRPVCGNCAKRYIKPSDCEYTALHPWPKPLGTTNPIPTPLNIPIHPLSASISSPSTRTFEMRLLHHYTLTVSPTLPSCNSHSSSAPLWQTRVPLLAFTSDLILDIVLSISALHLHSLVPSDRALPAATTYYLNRALSKHRFALAKIDASNAEQLLVAAILISTTTWLHSHRQDMHGGGGYEPPIHAYNMIRGVSALFLWQRDLFTRAGYGWFGDEEPIEINPSVLNLDANLFLKHIREDLTHLVTGLIVQYNKDPETFDAAVEYVFHLYAAYASNGQASHIHRLIGTMPVRLPTPFLRMLEEHNALAMALEARALVLLRGIEYAWWIRGRGPCDVLACDLGGMCSLMPGECAWAMDWPLGFLKKEREDTISIYNY